jgi:hypothetical protein
MNYLGCSLVHLNTNAISTLRNSVMLCECWLRIPLETSLFWYYYSPTRYTKTIFDGIGFSLRRNRRDEYIKTTFKGCWKGAQQKWILVDMHDQPPWVNKLLFPLAIKNKRSEPPMFDRLAALTKRVVELRQASRRATASKNSIFGGFAPSVGGRNRRSNVREWPIPTVNLQKIVSLSFLRIVDNSLV